MFSKKLTAAICMGIVSAGTAAKTIYKACGEKDLGCLIGSTLIGTLVGGTVANTALGVMTTVEKSITETDENTATEDPEPTEEVAEES